MKNKDNNIINNIKNDVPVAGSDLFADSENFLNELTDSELVQIRGGNVDADVEATPADVNAGVYLPSNVSLLLC